MTEYEKSGTIYAGSSVSAEVQVERGLNDTRLAVLGTRGTATLEVECRYTGTGAQTLRFKADGEEMQRLELAPSESWHALFVPLPPRTGLIAVDIEYDRLFENAEAARPRFPGYADAERDVRWPAVRYRRLQVTAGSGRP